MKINVEIEFDIEKLYQITMEEFSDWYQELSAIEKCKYDLFIAIHRYEQPGYYGVNIFIYCGNEYYRVIPKPKLAPFDIEDYKLGQIVIDKCLGNNYMIVDKFSYSVMLYYEREIYEVSIEEMYKYYTFPDGSSFEKEIK